MQNGTVGAPGPGGSSQGPRCWRVAAVEAMESGRAYEPSGHNSWEHAEMVVGGVEIMPQFWGATIL